MIESARKFRGTFFLVALAFGGIAQALAGGVGTQQRDSLIEAIKDENARVIELKGDIAEARSYEQAKAEADRQIGVSQERIEAIHARISASVERGLQEIERLKRHIHAHRKRLAELSQTKSQHRRLIKSTKQP